MIIPFTETNLSQILSTFKELILIYINYHSNTHTQYIVTVDVKGRSVKVTGPRGTLSKSFDHASVDINLVGKKELTVDLWFGNRKQIACIKTITSIIENMITGVTKGYEYKMRFVYAHFPINVAVTDGGRVVEIRNFFGEKIVRRIELLDGITCYRNEKAKG